MPAEPAPALTPAEVLDALPHRAPFRFVDEILELDDAHIVAAHRFRADADFYRGHFPGNPVTPGVLLLEAMAQAGVAAHAIYLFARQANGDAAGAPGAPIWPLFSEATVEFLGMVAPGERVLIRGKKLVFRRRLIRSMVEMTREDGTLVCSGTLTGVGVAT
jgi:3-hydroxyacyl-[acyl-carrier-protein] dehydratase